MGYGIYATGLFTTAAISPIVENTISWTDYVSKLGIIGLLALLSIVSIYGLIKLFKEYQMLHKENAIKLEGLLKNNSETMQKLIDTSDKLSNSVDKLSNHIQNCTYNKK